MSTEIHYEYGLKRLQRIRRHNAATSSGMWQAVIRHDERLIPGEVCHHWPFRKACNNKSTGPYLGTAPCKSPLLRVSCQCKLRRDQMFLSPHTAFLLRLFQMVVCREEQPQSAPPHVRGDAMGKSAQKYPSHKQAEQGVSHALRLSHCTVCSSPRF